MRDLTRCGWVAVDKPDYVRYHDTEWGVPVHDDRVLFEMLILEGAQAGLNWYSVLRRREGYRAAFRRFDVPSVARMTDAQLERVLARGDIIRNRLKVYSARANARVFLAIQEEWGSFDAYAWRFVGGAPRINRPRSAADVRSTSAASDAFSRDLKRRGMSFVGSTILYAYMQAVGMVNDHVRGCFRAAE
ncbi:MAG: DNA-3-methyladenine glycosylase I [Phycisphaerales bacterium]